MQLEKEYLLVAVKRKDGALFRSYGDGLAWYGVRPTLDATSSLRSKYDESRQGMDPVARQSLAVFVEKEEHTVLSELMLREYRGEWRLRLSATNLKLEFPELYLALTRPQSSFRLEHLLYVNIFKQFYIHLNRYKVEVFQREDAYMELIFRPLKEPATVAETPPAP